MRLRGLVALGALSLGSLCSCGSGGESTGPMDASLDRSMDVLPMEGALPDGSDASDGSQDAPAADAPLVDATITSTCNNAGLLAGCVVGACTVSATGKPLPTAYRLSSKR